ncbi:MAG TPA: CARDB domain-containing protein, partial [Candidatus Sulfomarinibacteraceae bacterium]|nr:CARDB domain-containing protein [Candidatus Sulfomarinibacteraceae bacterium]
GEPAAQSALDWLLARRTQGGLGEPYPDAATTAMFLATIHGRDVDQAIVDQAVGFLGSRQRTDGSWQGSVYHTALAVAALAPLVQPDLSVTASELLVEPESPFVDDQLTLVAAVHAANSDVQAGIGYRWEVLDSGQNLVAALDGVLPPIPSTLFATVSDTWNLRYNVSAGDHTFRFTVDPLGELAEPDETNNTAELTVVFRDHPSWIDLSLDPAEVWTSPPSIVTVPQALVVEGTVRNLGHATAGDAVIAVFDADTMALLGSTTVTVPPVGEAAFQVPVQLAEARPTLLAVVADPDDLLADGDPSNNRIDLALAVTPSFDPALAVGGLRILEPPPIHAGDPATIEVEVVNRGTLAVTDLQVGLSTLAGDPPVTSPLQLLTVDGELEPGASRILSWEWRPPNASSELTLAAEVDPSGLVADADRDNNTAELLLEVLPSPLPNLTASHTDIVFSPDPALQHETVTVSAIVRNQSDNPAGPFVVRLWIDEVGTGVPVGETAAVGLGPGEALTVEGAWIVDEMADRLVWVDVDADQQVVEFNEADNQAFRVLDVQTIPDLVLTSGQVSFSPSFPHSGDTVHFQAVVANTGDQPAASFEVSLALDDGTLLDTVIVPTIDGRGSATVAFDWTTTGVVGDVGLEITADPADAIVELSESNNLAAIALAVQDADLWVSERFISPDGDGVQDSTVVFVREPSGDVTVTDRDGEVVRTLPVDPATGQATWNGRNEGGGVVRDGVYELSSAGLATWVEVDLNGVRITDDIRQPLLVGTVPKSSTAPGSRFIWLTASPVDGVVYLVEQLGYGVDNRKVWRWAGAGLEDVPDWPAGHWDIHQMSADETVFITRPNSWSYELIRMPGGTVEQLPTPAGVDTPNLSPDGEWVVWVKKMPWASQQTVLLQHLDDPSEIHELGPYTTGWSAEWVNTATVHWTSDGRRAVVTMHCPGYPSPFGHALALVIELGTEPSVRERTLDRACATNASAGIAASVDFDRSRFYCIRDTDRALYEFDLETGTRLRTIDLPTAHGSTERWFRLSNDGRAVEVDETYPPDGPGKTMPEFFLYDWQRGVTAPWPSANVYFERTWSALDRHVYDSVTQHFTYRTPTANLAVALEPVVRFGGEGIDLVLTAVDRNLDRHWLEIAPAADPEAFVPIGQPSREVMVGDTWGTWIPPSAGAWRLRLTAADLAGNRRSASRWVTWNGANDIAGLWLEDRRISPLASPGVRDELVWHYTVLRPAQLLFEIVEPSGAVVRRIPVAADEPGAATTSWDGLDEAGRPVPDGDYALDFRGAAWPVAVDNTPPATTFEIGPTRLRPTADEIAAAASTTTPVELGRSALFNEVSWAVDDAKLERAGFESRRPGDVDWSPLSGPSPFSTVTAPAADRDEVQAGWFADRVLRQTAVDLAGNSSTAERLHVEERLAFAVAEPPCRSDPSPCLFPDRPEVHQLGDADGLMDADVAVLWPFYSTLLVQGALAGDWRDTLRLEFRVPADGGSAPGDWQPGTLTPADQPLRRRVKVPTGDPVAPWGHLEAPVLPVYWEHPGLPQRPYEVRLVVQGSGGEVASPPTLMVPNSPLAVEYLRTDGGGDHFRVHNIGVATLNGIELQASRDTFGWWAVTAVGSLEAGRSVLVSTGCALYDAAVAGNLAGWVRAVGIDPVGATQASLPAALQRAGPARAVSHPGFTLIRGGCGPGSSQATGMAGYQSNPQGGLMECTSWRCDHGWHTPGGLVDLQMAIPDTDPTGTPIVGYELLVDGVTVAGAPELAPGTAGHVILDFSALAEGEHVMSERYLFAPGDDGLLSACVQSAPLHVDRSAAVTITSPTAGTSLCPDQGLSEIEAQIGETPWSVTYLVDGSSAAITEHPTTREPAISVSALEPGSHTLTAEVIDLAGNPACDAVDFTSEGVAAVTGLTVEPQAFSPVNDLGRPTAATISFGSTATASYVVEIRDGFDDQVAVIDGFVDAGGTVSTVWDGRIFGGPFAPDGSYRVWIRLESDCGATFVTPEPLPTVEVDTSGPVVVIGQPWPGAWVQTGLEIAGLVADPHFEGWRAELRPAPPVPGAWQTIASGDRPSGHPDTILARWPVTGLPEGDYELRIEAVDLPGNRTVTPSVPFELHPLQLIARLDAEPIYFSPNGDGAADTTGFSFELLEEVEVWLGFEGAVNLISGEVLAPGMTHRTVWDGLDDLLQPMPDGAYTFSLGAHRLDMTLFETDGVTVVVDRTPPSVILASPQPGALLSPPVTVSGTTDDLYPDSYTVSLLHPDGTTVELLGGLGRWDTDDSVVLSDLADGAYALTVAAADLASNHASVEVDFEVDQTAPSVLITAPAAGALLDPAANQLVLRATVAAAHPDSLAWWIAPGADPATDDFVLVHSAPLTAGGAVEHTWSGAPPADGVHTLRLTVLDQLGRTGEGRVVFAVDSEPPLAQLHSPADGATLLEPVPILGTTGDANLEHWFLEEVIGGGGAGRVLASGTEPADGELALWDPLPADGPATLRLRAVDGAGHAGEASVAVTVSVLPPGAPQGLAVQLEGRDATLSWQPGPGAPPVGFHVERNGLRITSSPVASTVFPDPQLLDGHYRYHVVAVGPAGRESEPSDEAAIVVDLTPPTVALTAPGHGQRVGGEVAIRGTAFAEDDFGHWQVSARAAGGDWLP